eukprot:45130-Eustigmatos_ZCMA.PRE.1
MTTANINHNYLFSTCDMNIDMKRVCILFLAHDCITNPQVWEEWRRGQEHRVVFKILRNEEVKYPTKVCDKYDTGLRYKTGWGSTTTVTATIRAMHHIIEGD